MTELTKLDGIGPKRARVLAAAGLRTLADVATADAPGLAGRLGIDEATAANVIAQAAQLAQRETAVSAAPTVGAPTPRPIHLLTGVHRG